MGFIGDVVFDKLILICLAIFSLLFGIFTVTNIRVEWGNPLMGFAALVLGIVCIVRLVRA